MKIGLRNIALTGLAGSFLGLLSFIAYEYETPGALIGGGALLWGVIKSKLYQLFSSSGKANSVDENEVLRAKVKYLEAQNRFYENQLKSPPFK